MTTNTHLQDTSMSDDHYLLYSVPNNDYLYIQHTLTHIYSRRSRARRTRQSRQATQPVPMDILDRIKKHDEELSKSEDSSGSSSTNSTPPQKRKDEEKAPAPTSAPTMSAYRPSARPASKILNQQTAPSQQMLWSMPSRRKEPAVETPPPKPKGERVCICEGGGGRDGTCTFIYTVSCTCIIVFVGHCLATKVFILHVHVLVSSLQKLSLPSPNLRPHPSLTHLRTMSANYRQQQKSPLT